MQIRMDSEYGNWPNEQINVVSCLSMRLLYFRRYVFWPVNSFKYIFHVKFNFLWRYSLTRIRPHGSALVRLSGSASGSRLMRIHDIRLIDFGKVVGAFVCSSDRNRNTPVPLLSNPRFTLFALRPQVSRPFFLVADFETLEAQNLHDC